MIIAIGGTAGSGTTTAAKVLAEKLNIPFVSAGSIFREMARERGMTPVEFGKFAENNTDIDKEIDNRQAELAKEAQDLIVEGRLSAYFVDADLKVCFTAPLEVRAKRVCEREGKSIELAKREIIAREESEAIRYMDIMAAIEVGRKCIKTAGREAGKECEIVAIIDENFVEVKGDEVKNRRCNINHLEPIME